MVEHRGGADLGGAAAEEEVVEGVFEGGDAADAGEGFVGERFCELGHLG